MPSASEQTQTVDLAKGVYAPKGEKPPYPDPPTPPPQDESTDRPTVTITEIVKGQEVYTELLAERLTWEFPT